MVCMNVAKRLGPKFLAVLSLMFILSTSFFAFHPVAAQNTDYIEKCYNWNYDGKHWNWNLSIPTSLYEAYKAVSVSSRTRDGPAGYGYLTTTKDQYIQMLASKLNQTTTDLGYSSYDQVSFVLAFVQSLQYTSDNVTTGYDEYPRFPIETLVDEGGDCEDTSILFATITHIMGYGTVYINPTNHYAVGILGSNLRGTYWEYPEGSNSTYYYCETTGDNFKIGQLPAAFSGTSAHIYPIDENNQFVPDVEIVISTPTPVPTKIPLQGSAIPTAPPIPNNGDPTAQTPLPLSFNLIADNLVVSFVLIFAIAFSVVMAMWSARRHHRHSNALSSGDTSSLEAEDDNKYCIYCGEDNKGYAVFCEKCGKQIG